jgi:hypothetical protein
MRINFQTDNQRIPCNESTIVIYDALLAFLVIRIHKLREWLGICLRQLLHEQKCHEKCTNWVISIRFLKKSQISLKFRYGLAGNLTKRRIFGRNLSSNVGYLTDFVRKIWFERKPAHFYSLTFYSFYLAFGDISLVDGKKYMTWPKHIFSMAVSKFACKMSLDDVY